MSITFPCHCKFPLKESGEDISVNFGDLLPPLAKLNIYDDIEEDCPAVWEMLGRGMSRGCFQLESNLGKDWSEKIKPESLEELSDLVSLIRPGCLRAFSGNPPKSMTQRYADRKNKSEEVSYLHPSLEPILKSTQGVLISQEQSMRIASELAGFDLQQADILRRAIGKKKADVMGKMKTSFIKGCQEEGGLEKGVAEEIFGWIRESQRYSFNKCLLPSVEVETPDGIKTLEEIEVGDFVYAPLKQSPRWKDDFDGFVEVLNKYDQGEQEVFKYTLTSGESISCTKNHKFLCSGHPITRNTVSSIFDVIRNDMQIFSRKGYHYIDRLECLGTQKTLDIEVNSPLHLFYANGIATSNSHGISYGKILYWTAYMKVHFPLQFFRSYIDGSNDKGDKKYDEIRDMVYEAKLFDIEVEIPQLDSVRRHTFIKGRNIFFGLREIKGVGESSIGKILSELTGDKFWDDWDHYLIFSSHKVSSTVNEALIKSGVLDCYHVPRNKMLYEYETWKELTKKEQEWVREFAIDLDETCLESCLEFCKPTKKEGGGTHSKKRKEKVSNLLDLLKDPPYNLEDSVSFIAGEEEAYWGIPITYGKVDAYEDVQNATATCKEIVQGRPGTNILGVEILNCKEILTKTGKKPGSPMCFLTVTDGTSIMDNVVCFPKEYKMFKGDFYEGNMILLCGEKSKGFIVKSVKRVEK